MASDAPTNATSAGTVLADRYHLGRLIARGGMADVFEGHDALLGRPVAVKVFRAAEAAHRERFDAEVRLLAGLNHPGLVAVYDAGEHGGDGFMVLELVEGPSLRSTLAERAPLPEAEVARLGATVAEALAHVHARGIVHRDLTPANVLCGPDGTPRLTDFGIARLLDTTRVTAEHLTVGTVGYMAPEQVEGEDVTPAADVYALGLVLLEALTGAPAFTGPSHEVAVARLTRDPVVPDHLPGPWPELLRSMTARQPGDRPTAASVAAALRARLREGEPASGGGRGVVVGAGAPLDPAAPTSPLPVAVTGPAPDGASPGQPPPGTAVMPAALLPAEPGDQPGGELAGPPGAAPDPAGDAGGVAEDRRATLAPALAAWVASASTVAASAGRRLVRRVRRLTFRQWLLVALAAAFVFAASQSTGGDWGSPLRAATQADPPGSRAAVPPSTSVPAEPAPPAPDDAGSSEERGGGRPEAPGRGRGAGAARGG